jgi:hypothetical protein
VEKTSVDDDALGDRLLLAAIAAALLGSQGSPVWSRTAELLLLSFPGPRRHYNRAADEMKRIIGDDVVGR